MCPSKQNSSLDAPHLLMKELAEFRKAYQKILTDTDPRIKEVLTFLKGDCGKGLRPVLFFLSQGLLKRPAVNSAPIAGLLELLHTATIIHDDIVDNGETRRGRKAAHTIWPGKSSILLGDYLFARVFSLCVESEWPQVLPVISDVVQRMARGELIESLKEGVSIPSESQYFSIIEHKTGALFEASCVLGGIVGGGSTRQISLLKELGGCFGSMFQIQDDILDYTGNETVTGKQVRKDLFNKSITLPFIYVYERLSIEEQEQYIASLQSRRSRDIHALYDSIIDRGGVSMARHKALVIKNEAEALLEQFEDNPYKKFFMDILEDTTMRNS